jgi:hypothetical protein
MQQSDVFKFIQIEAQVESGELGIAWSALSRGRISIWSESRFQCGTDEKNGKRDSQEKNFA